MTQPRSRIKELLIYLQKHKVKAGFDKKCLSVVVLRMIEQSSDYRLNPALQSGCRQDIVKFCSHVVATQPKDMELEGKVVKCLKVKFREHLLRKDCEVQISSLVSEAALNYKMNPALALACKFEVDTLCEDKKGEMGAVEECLRENLVDGHIEAHDCRVEVSTYIRDSFGSSLDLDPLLQQACAADDAKFCSKGIENGNQAHCGVSQKIYINGYPPETFGELYSQVSHSPSRKYFLLIALSCIGLFFILGLFCGRASRRNVVLKKR
ncbi:hypothetical protein J437_LFUL012739 [Ladona fulva]|uniref:Golgi apparatus protein 1 n=1 Tax=Ladona fulva TaxID=123851 RepID=A0A8K0KQV4_LADFU|nr:hypothetical protein J437_LFUL012739 [Ladona fulva]